MSAEIVQLVPPSVVDDAWDEFQDFAVRLLQQPELSTDRAFMESHATARIRWERLSYMSGRVG